MLTQKKKIANRILFAEIDQYAIGTEAQTSHNHAASKKYNFITGLILKSFAVHTTNLPPSVK